MAVETARHDKSTTLGVIGTILGRLADLGLYGSKVGGAIWAADEEQIHPIEETRRKRATDLALIKAGKTPGSYMGTLRQEQYLKMLAEHDGPGVEMTLKDIDVIMHGTGYEAPDTLEDFGPNFKPWVQKNKETLAKIPGWECILNGYGLEPTVQYGLGAPVQKQTFEQYRAECKA